MGQMLFLATGTCQLLFFLYDVIFQNLKSAAILFYFGYSILSLLEGVAFHKGHLTVMSSSVGHRLFLATARATR